MGCKTERGEQSGGGVTVLFAIDCRISAIQGRKYRGGARETDGDMVTVVVDVWRDVATVWCTR